jgi:ABC-type protease/lipase transport system fused ATPase/permease subunit
MKVDKIAVMGEGRLIQYGPRDSILKQSSSKDS